MSADKDKVETRNAATFVDSSGGNSTLVCEMSSSTVFCGGIAHFADDRLQTFSGHIVIEDGKIVSIGTEKNVEKISKKLNLNDFILIELEPSQLIIPGFIDCHLHAPQFPNIGLGLDKPLLEWLSAYTFPLEKLYEDITFATTVYDTVVNKTLKNGTTTACYFGTLHMEGSTVLAAAAEDYGQRALIGKVSMNVPNDAEYFNTTEKEIEETEAFIKIIQAMDKYGDIIEPVITPRFAISCDEELLMKLGELAKKYDCKIQTHISENIGEVEAVKKMFPKQKTYAEVYDKAGLLNNKCILAHAIHLQDSEIDLLVQRGVSIAHCPASNTRLLSGMCPVRKLMKKGLKVGLGTDVSGGDSPSILHAIRRTMDVSTHLCLKDEKYANECPPLSWEDAFYLATLGGAQALSLDHKVGSFKLGKDFDALIIDVECKDSPIDKYRLPEFIPALSPSTPEDNTKRLLQQFIYLGDDRNIKGIFVKGRKILV